ncbi:hypothetical protein GCK72_014797 [Caenorhabditis remanei]|uniref:Uncharacterized protein n=1 Tax=Caenorhabditis remanei TaxID=31234 RepID=A0A2P4W5E4_CAERE|nr:hypothetical protein GCK72_014797 [Caenorhabditis remanei]KAF1758339.1 hypothetical protein GCK72_014797 [Caenorhabditis remanei]
MALRRPVSPQLSNRSSPPVTRSVSRNGSRQPFETSTPLTRRSLQPGMHIDTIERVFESADDTDVDLNSSKFIYREHFTVTERTSIQKELWYDWLVYHIRMIRRHLLPEFKTVRETMMVLLLLLMITKYARDCYSEEMPKSFEQHQPADYSSEWIAEIQKIEKSISSLQAKIDSTESNLHQLENHLNQFDLKTDQLINQLNDDNGWKESVMEELKRIKVWQTESDLSMHSLKKEVEEKNCDKVIAAEEEKKPAEPTPSFPSDIQVHSSQTSRRPHVGINVANSLIGASIDNSCSSRPVSAKDGIFYDVMSYFGSFKEGYVLLDRDVLSPGEAWCTNDDRPTLTIKLARHIVPTSVSYQHVRWSGIVPNHAPKVYDLVACMDSCCIRSEPLVTDCEYKSSNDEHDEQEQFCSIPSNPNLSSVNHVQFRFRENHGNMKKTCAYLVRVYGDLANPPNAQTPDNATASLLEETVADSMSESV